ncbi:MAG: hypothetical protein WCI73_15645, partial [Phycisphaerae bacterium]
DTHPDYMNMDERPCRFDEYPRQLYDDFLAYLTARYAGQFWAALPRDAACYCAGLPGSAQTSGCKEDRL